jgi:hypothetical protein
MDRISVSEKHLSTEFRSDLRYFAFFVANGSLFASRLWNGYGFPYIPFLLEKNSVFGRMFSIFVNVWRPCGIEERATREPRLIPDYRAEQYLMNLIEPSREVVPALQDWELIGVNPQGSWKDSVKAFSISLGDGRLQPDLLADIDYVPGLFNCGSTLEAIYAVFSNVLTIDERGNPTNQERAYFRAAQCVKQWCVPGYRVEPQFAGWETELH